MKALALVGAIALTLSLAAPALADDDFSGLYVGVNVGSGSGVSNAHTSTVFDGGGYFAASSVTDINRNGAFAVHSPGNSFGGQIGYNFQKSTTVWGVEADYSSLGFSGGASAGNPYPCCPTTSYMINQSIATSGLMTARIRVGFVSNGALYYATGGVASTKVNYQASFSDTFATAAENGGFNQNRSGSVFGAGAEFKLNPRTTMKFEYLALNLGDVSTTSTNLTAFTPAIAFPTNVFTHGTNLTANLFRFGINFKL